MLCIQEIGEKLSEIGSRFEYPRLNRELAEEIETLWKDGAIQVIPLHVGCYDLHFSMQSYPSSFTSLHNHCKC